MCIDISHLVFESSADPNNQVVNEALDRSKGGNILASTVVEFDINHGFRGFGETD